VVPDTHPSPDATKLVVDIRSRFIDYASGYFRCWDSQVGWLNPSLEGGNVVRVFKDSMFGVMMLGNGTEGYQLEPYRHVVDGVEQKGLFVGAQGKTTWGFNWMNGGCGDGIQGLNYVEARLQGLPYDENVVSGARFSPEWLGFIKVTNAFEGPDAD
jgi:hypothetical protein